MVIGGSTPSPSAILDLQSTSKGLLPPRMTTEQRDAISAPAKGLILFNTTENRIQINQGEPDAPVWKNLSIGETLPETGNSNGNMLYWNGSSWTRLAPGLPGQRLSLSAEGYPVWTGATLASLTTTTPADITPTSATVGGQITSDGGASISAKGIVWATTANPTLSASVLDLSGGSGVFSGTLSGLSPNTLYYLRAFATNSAGTTYGNELSFSTLPMSVPILSTNSITSITQTSAIVGGNITNDGGAAIIQRGVAYGTAQNPTLADAFTQDGSGSGNFTSTLNSLSPNTTYYVRAYATNSIGTAYGSQQSFETIVPVVSSPSLVNLPAGTFSMGCTPGDPNCGTDEFPVHSVTLSAFQIGETEVTQEQWLSVIEWVNPSFFKDPPCPQCPVEQVSWYDALVYCNRLSELEGLTPCYYSDSDFTQVYGKSGSIWVFPNSGTVYWNPAAKGYRLPTEAEWEYAARGGSATNIYSGGNTLTDVGWHDENSGGSTKAVKGLLPNGYGLYDMSGNVWECCWDLHSVYPSSSQVNPVGPLSGGFRVLRGGDWRHSAEGCRLARRGMTGNYYRNFNVGFRLARTP